MLIYSVLFIVSRHINLNNNKCRMFLFYVATMATTAMERFELQKNYYATEIIQEKLY